MGFTQRLRQAWAALTAPSASPLPPARPTLAATGTVTTPAIPLPPRGPDWDRLAAATTKAELALLDADLARNGRAPDGQLRTALKAKYEAIP